MVCAGDKPGPQRCDSGRIQREKMPEDRQRSLLVLSLSRWIAGHLSILGADTVTHHATGPAPSTARRVPVGKGGLAIPLER